MSLVNDALKKARLEAARQNAARRGLPMPGARLAEPPGSGTRTLARLALLAGVALIALLLFLAGKRFAGPASPSPTEATVLSERAPVAPPTLPGTAEPETAALEEVVRAVPEPAPQPASPPSPPSSRARQDAAAPPGASDGSPSRPAATEEGPPVPAAPPVRSEPETTEPAAVSTPAPPTSVPAEPAGAPAGVDEPSESRVRIVTPSSVSAQAPRSVVRVLELPDAVRIELGGIAWSEQRPFALLNGRVVGPGETVESLTVVAIAQSHVELEGEAGHFLLRLK